MDRISNAIQTFTENISNTASRAQRGIQRIASGIKPSQASRTTSERVETEAPANEIISNVGEQLATASKENSWTTGFKPGGRADEAPQQLKQTSAQTEAVVRQSVLGQGRTLQTTSERPEVPTQGSRLQARAQSVNARMTRAGSQVRNAVRRGTTFASTLQTRILSQFTQEVTAEEPTSQFSALAQKFEPIEERAVQAGLKTWGQDNAWSKALPPDEESKRLRSGSQDVKPTQPVGKGIQVSDQVSRDFGRSISVTVGETNGRHQEFGPEGYGLAENDWDPEGNKALDVFQSIEQEIKNSPSSEGLSEEQIQNLVHTAMDGACQTFDAPLSNPINKEIAPDGALGDMNILMRSGGTPQLNVRVEADTIIVSKDQPMKLTMIDLDADVPVQMSRSFAINMNTGTCTQTSAKVEIQWNQRTEMT